MGMLEISYGVQVSGFLLHVVAISTNGWFRTNRYNNVGLFKACTSLNCYQITSLPAFFNTLRGITCLGFILLLIAFIMATVYITKQHLRGNKKYRWAVAILVLLGGILIFVGPLFGFGKAGFVPKYSLYVAILAGILSIVAGVFHTVVVHRTVFE